jgi:hypothetical protein
LDKFTAMPFTAPPKTTMVGKLAQPSGEVLSLLAGSRAGDAIAAVVSAETGKSLKDAKGEKDGVIGEAELPRVLEAVA